MRPQHDDFTTLSKLPMTTSPLILRLAAVLVSAIILSAMPARADFLISAPTLSVAPGDAGSFDVTLQNTGLTSLDVGTFSVRIDLLSPPAGVRFTDATQPTAGYVFAGQLENGNAIGFMSTGFTDPITTTPLPGSATGVSGSDLLLFDPPATSVAPAASYSLMKVYYQIDPGTVDGLVTIAFDEASTQVLDGDGNPVGLSFANGAFDVSGSGPAMSTPAPPTVILAGLGVFGLFTASRRRTRRVVR